ncbi:MAG: hypothetical protein J6I76_16225 [Oribacterium sp.]|nr:hypothetical protein [Lachnospiraceae bacterium]MBP3805406.1 hypothetical protein [Oribacterium sp.]
MDDKLKDRVLEWLSSEMKRSFDNVCDNDLEMQKVQQSVNDSFDKLKASVPDQEDTRRELLRYVDSRDALEQARARHGVVLGIALMLLLFQELEYI